MIDRPSGGVRLATRLAAALALLVTCASWAQEPWEGDEELIIVVTDERGQPVPGVLVVMLYGEEGVRGPALTTDSRGRVEVEGLAAGEWQVDLRRESFMLVTSYVKLEAGSEPEVAFSSRQRTGGYWAPLRAVFLPGGTDVSSSVAAGTVSLRKAQKQRQRQQRQADKASKREERRHRRGRVARLVDVAPPASGEAADRQAPVAQAPVPGRYSADAKLLPAGACRECAEGEWSVTTAVRVAAATPSSCSAARYDWNAFADALGPHWQETGHVGGVFGEDEEGIFTLLDEGPRQSLEADFGSWFGEEGSCSALGIVLPAGSRYVGFRYQAGERATVADCLIGEECQIGEARFVGEPLVVVRDGFTLVGARFENGSQARARVGSLTVYFAPPRGWLPSR